MAPRKPVTPKVRPTVVRRIVKTVTTEEVIEVIPTPGAKKTIQKTSAICTAPRVKAARSAVKCLPKKSASISKGAAAAKAKDGTKKVESKTQSPVKTSKAVGAKNSALKSKIRKNSPAKTATVKTTPAKTASVKTAPVNAAPAKATAKKITPAKVAAKKTTPAKVTAKKTTPAKVTAKKTTPAKVTAKKTTPAKVTAKKTTPTKVTARKTTPAKVTAKKTTPAKVTAKKTTPAKVIAKKTTPAKAAVKKSTSTKGTQSMRTPARTISAKAASSPNRIAPIRTPPNSDWLSPCAINKMTTKKAVVTSQAVNKASTSSWHPPANSLIKKEVGAVCPQKSTLSHAPRVHQTTFKRKPNWTKCEPVIGSPTRNLSSNLRVQPQPFKSRAKAAVDNVIVGPPQAYTPPGQQHANRIATKPKAPAISMQAVAGSGSKHVPVSLGTHQYSTISCSAKTTALSSGATPRSTPKKSSMGTIGNVPSTAKTENIIVAARTVPETVSGKRNTTKPETPAPKKNKKALKVQPPISKARKTPALKTAASKRTQSGQKVPIVNLPIANSDAAVCTGSHLGALQFLREDMQQEIDIPSLEVTPSFPGTVDVANIHGCLPKLVLLDPSDIDMNKHYGLSNSANRGLTSCLGQDKFGEDTLPVSRISPAACPSSNTAAVTKDRESMGIVLNSPAGLTVINSDPKPGSLRDPGPQNSKPPQTHLGTNAPFSRSRRVSQTAIRSSSSSKLDAGILNADSQLQASKETIDVSCSTQVWYVTHERGFVPDRFHSYVEPEKRDLGTFSTRAAAVRKGQEVIGSDVGYSWSEVRDGGDLETVADTPDLLEICWSPPDSEYSRITARRISTVSGRWIIETEQGFEPNGFHSYMEPSREVLGPFRSRIQAVQEGEKAVGAYCGYEWNEVLDKGDCDILADTPNRWEVRWSPPDSQYSHVVVKLLPLPPA